MAPARGPRYLSSSDPIVRLAPRLVQRQFRAGDEPGSSRLSKIDTTPRILEHDHTEEPHSEGAENPDGLLFAEISMTSKGTDNVAYSSFFWAIDDAAIGCRFQQALGRRRILRLDAFASLREDRDEGCGVCSEL